MLEKNSWLSQTKSDQTKYFNSTSAPDGIVYHNKINENSLFSVWGKGCHISPSKYSTFKKLDDFKHLWNKTKLKIKF